MELVLVNQFFYPDCAATSQLLTDLAWELGDRGHRVAVICGSAGYHAADSIKPPPVVVFRSRPLPFSHNPFVRVASYASFLAAAVVRSLRGTAPDVILTLTTPPLLGLVGTLVKRLRGARHFTWEMDLYPDIAEDLRILRPSSIVSRFIGALGDHVRRHADGVIALGDDMKRRLVARGIPELKIHVVHNWADGREIHPLPWTPFPLTVHYSGNMGLAHDTETLRLAMFALRDDARFHFIFSGGGPQKANLETFCTAHALRHVEFRPYCDRAMLGQSLAEGHLGLVTQKPETVGSVVPSKVYGIMAAGRPILYIGSRHATPAQIIDRFHCGWYIEAGDSNALVSLLCWLAEHPAEIRSAGERARQAFLENFDRPLGVARIVSFLQLEQVLESPQNAFAQQV